eukprot:437334_1
MSALLTAGIVFTVIYAIVFIILIISAITGGIEGDDGGLCVIMTITILVSLPLMWLFFTGDIPDSKDIGFWIFCTLPLWCILPAIYLAIKNGHCGSSTKQILCCCCCPTRKKGYSKAANTVDE